MANKGCLNQIDMKKWLNKMDNILDSHFVFQGDGPSEIIPGLLWLGDYEDAYNIQLLEQIGISWILNCAGGEINNIAYPSHFKVHKFDGMDHWKYNLIEQHLDHH